MYTVNKSIFYFLIIVLPPFRFQYLHCGKFQCENFKFLEPLELSPKESFYALKKKEMAFLISRLSVSIWTPLVLWSSKLIYFICCISRMLCSCRIHAQLKRDLYRMVMEDQSYSRKTRINFGRIYETRVSLLKISFRVSIIVILVFLVF